jgi:hypothetical protein
MKRGGLFRLVVISIVRDFSTTSQSDMVAISRATSPGSVVCVRADAEGKYKGVERAER